jgi:thioredoxin 1
MTGQVLLALIAVLSCNACNATPFVSDSLRLALASPSLALNQATLAYIEPVALEPCLVVPRGGAVLEPETLQSVDDAIAAAVASGKAVVLDFSATWCGPCKMISPVYSLLSDEFKDSIVFIKVDVDVNAETAAKYDVTAMPTFVFISKSGEVVDRLAGANADRLREMVAALLTR